MKKPYVSPRAFSEDGYIINQNLLKNLPYGMKQSNYNGCGWIAAYNFLHACGRQKEYDTVRQQLEDSLIFGGLFGTHIMQLYLYLRRHGFHLHWACRPKTAQKQAQRCKVGILFYFNGAALHFVTFVPADGQLLEKDESSCVDADAALNQSEQFWYRFFNGRMGEQQDLDTWEHFFEEESVASVVIQLTTK